MIKRVVLVIVLGLGVTHSPPAKAQADIPILLEILANAISQLYQIMEMVETARANLQLMKDISSGLDNALQMYSQLTPPADPGLYRDWRTMGDTLQKMQMLYGTIAATKESAVQTDLDQGIAEAIQLNNQVYDYSEKADLIGKSIERQADASSPKGRRS